MMKPSDLNKMHLCGLIW